MKWQDALITVGSILFIIALLPTMFGKNKPPLFTALLTGSVLLAFAFAYGTLDLTFACITTAITGFQWLLIAAQVRLKNTSESATVLHKF